MCRVFSLRCLVCLSLPHSFAISSPLPLRLDSESLRLHLGPLRPLFWLHARLCAFLWRCACSIHRRSGSTMIFSTTSCVCSTHRCTLTFCFLLLLPSLGRISCASILSLLPRAPSAPQLLSCVFLAPLALSFLLHALSLSLFSSRYSCFLLSSLLLTLQLNYYSTPLHSTPLHSTPLHSTPLHSTPLCSSLFFPAHLCSLLPCAVLFSLCSPVLLSSSSSSLVSSFCFSSSSSSCCSSSSSFLSSSGFSSSFCSTSPSLAHSSTSPCSAVLLYLQNLPFPLYLLFPPLISPSYETCTSSAYSQLHKSTRHLRLVCCGLASPLTVPLLRNALSCLAPGLWFAPFLFLSLLYSLQPAI